MSIKVFLTVPSSNISALAGAVVTQIANAQQNPTTGNVGLVGGIGSTGSTGPRGFSVTGPTGASGAGGSLSSGYFSFTQTTSSGSNDTAMFSTVATYNGIYTLSRATNLNDTITLPITDSSGAIYVIRVYGNIDALGGVQVSGTNVYTTDIAFNNGTQLSYVGGSAVYYNSQGTGVGNDTTINTSAYGIWSIPANTSASLQVNTAYITSGSIEIIQIQ